MVAASPVTSSGPSASDDPFMRAAVKDYLLKERDDAVVLTFGRDYFHGARTGSGFGGLFSSAWCFSIYRRMKKDQREANFEVGLKPGQRNPNFSRWVIARGLRTQPMLTVGCCALFATSLFKAAKLYLAHRRCLEFQLDDVEFAMLAQMSKEDPVTRELFEKLCSDAAASPSSASSPFFPTPTGAATAVREAGKRPAHTAADGYRSMEQMLREDASVAAAMGGHGGAVSSARPPTYWDGVAVGVMGSIMDCYVPMKPVYRYYNMHFGMV